MVTNPLTEARNDNLSLHLCSKNDTYISIKVSFKGKTLQLLIFMLYYLTIKQFLIMTPEAERFNGWAAMLGFVAAVGAYVSTGQIIPGWF